MKPKYRRMIRGMKDVGGNWSLYILKCCDGSLYTGISNNIDRRFLAHQEGKASRYTRTRRPVALVYREECGSRSQALTRECAVKTLSRPRKDALILTSPAAPAYKSLKRKKGTRP
jgi:predicted GIY-YIG superfamily endonuclease